jgi:hypothetical protein
MTGAMLLLLVVPLALAVSTIVEYADDIVGWAKTAATVGVPSPPEWVGRIPLVGSRLLRHCSNWRRPTTRSWRCRWPPTHGLLCSGSPAGRAGDLGALLVHFLLPS